MNFKPLDIIIIVLIVSGGLFSVVISFAQLMIKDKKSINYIGFALYFLYGASIICDTRYRLGTEHIAPHLLYINYPLVLLLGPVIFFYFRILVNDNVKFKLKYLLIYLPGILVFLYFNPFYIQNADTKMLLYPLSNNENIFIRYSYNIIDYSLIAYVFFCFLLSFRYTYFLWNKKTLVNIKFIRIILLYMVFWISFIGFMVYSDVTDSFFLYKIGVLLSVLFIIFSVFMSHRYPDFYNIIRKETSIVKYKNSQIKGLNLKAVINRINELMEYEKIYSDESLTLNKLSEILNITTHQLSEILNKNFDLTFNTFINNYRIEAAKKMLINNPGYSILSIAFHCGFNSKTTFNTAFLKNTALSPSAYREKYKK